MANKPKVVSSEVLQEVINHTRHVQLEKQKLRDDPSESWRHDYLDGAIETLEEIRIHMQGLIAWENQKSGKPFIDTETGDLYL